MDETKIKSLCISTTDYKDNDKILNLVGIDCGKYSAVIKSVKSPKSKLRMCAEPLCFGEYIIEKKSNRKTVIGCTIEDNFFNCWSNIDKNVCAVAITEVLDKSTTKDIPCNDELKLTLQALSGVCYADISPYAVVAWYLSKMMVLDGEDINSEFVPNKIIELIGNMQRLELTELETLEITYLKIYDCIKYQNMLLSNIFGTKINALSEILRKGVEDNDNQALK